MASPDLVIGAAERLGRLHDLGRQVRAATVRSFREAPADALLFVNLHTRDLLDPSLYGNDEPLLPLAKRVVLEITERASLDVVKDVPARVSALRKRGFRIAVDDLGAGYAGLTSFTQLEPEFVKLDMSLVHDVQDSTVKQRVIASLAELCHELQLQVIAEGVEIEAECSQVCALGCDLLQGYLFARPQAGFAVNAAAAAAATCEVRDDRPQEVAAEPTGPIVF
jgi:EAL domain-containing protein (putative c-di-GMP-specific phosphodiesterase class I)